MGNLDSRHPAHLSNVRRTESSTTYCKCVLNGVNMNGQKLQASDLAQYLGQHLYFGVHRTVEEG